MSDQVYSTIEQSKLSVGARCPRCGGRLFQEGDDLICLSGHRY